MRKMSSVKIKMKRDDSRSAQNLVKGQTRAHRQECLCHWIYLFQDRKKPIGEIGAIRLRGGRSASAESLCGCPLFPRVESPTRQSAMATERRRTPVLYSRAGRHPLPCLPPTIYCLLVFSPRLKTTWYSIGRTLHSIGPSLDYTGPSLNSIGLTLNSIGPS